MPRFVRTIVVLFAFSVLLCACDVLRQAAPSRNPTPTVAAGAAVSPAEEHVERGDALFGQEDYVRAIDEYTTALELAPRSAEIYNNRGLAYYRSGQLEDALADYNQALALRPDYVNALTNRAFIFFDQGNYDACIADARRALELEEGNDSAHMIRGNAELRQGDLRHALLDFLEAEQIRRARRAE